MTLSQQLVLSVSHDMLKWHADNQSGEFHVGREDDAVGMVIYTRQTALLSGLVRAIEHHKETERQRQQVVQYVKEAKQVGLKLTVKLAPCLSVCLSLSTCLSILSNSSVVIEMNLKD